MTKPWLVKVGVLFIKKRGCIVLTHPLFDRNATLVQVKNAFFSGKCPIFAP